MRPGFSEVYYIHDEVEGLAVWVGGCRGGNLGVEGDYTPYLNRHWPVFVVRVRLEDSFRRSVYAHAKSKKRGHVSETIMPGAGTIIIMIQRRK